MTDSELEDLQDLREIQKQKIENGTKKEKMEIWIPGKGIETEDRNNLRSKI